MVFLQTAHFFSYSASGKSTNPPSKPIVGIERKTWLKLLGITLQNDPSCWDLHVSVLLCRASSRMYIMRTCKFNGYSNEQLQRDMNKAIQILLPNHYSRA